MWMIRVAVATLVAVLSPSGDAQAQDEADEVLSPDEYASIANQIGRNWNVAPQALGQCREKIRLRVHLATDGTVTKVDELSDLAHKDCRAASALAVRAVRTTRRLTFSEKIPPTIQMMFDVTPAVSDGGI